MRIPMHTANIFVLFQEWWNADRLPEFRAQRLEAVKKEVARLPEGAWLLRRAQKLGVDIRMEPVLRDRGAYAVYLPTGKNILLDHRTGTKKLTKALFHELRHMWQFSRVKDLHARQGLPISSRMVLLRLLEGDAHVFEKTAMLRLAGKNPRPSEKEGMFWKFQKSLKGGTYGMGVLEDALDHKTDTQEGLISESPSGMAALADIRHIGRIIAATTDKPRNKKLDAAAVTRFEKKILASAGTREKLYALAIHRENRRADGNAPSLKGLSDLFNTLAKAKKSGPEVFDGLGFTASKKPSIVQIIRQIIRPD